MSATLTLSGWSQPADALAGLYPDAILYDYSDHSQATAALQGLSHYTPDYVVAWSLGGQLALRAIAAGIINPRHLTLIAAPFKFVGKGGMGEQTFSQFVDNYSKDPARTKQRFHGLVAKGDHRAREVMEKLQHHADVENVSRFLPWLEELGRFDASSLSLANLPPTLIIHGMNDQVVPIQQGETLQKIMPFATLSRWADTGHAPHVSDPTRLLQEITKHRSMYE